VILTVADISDVAMEPQHRIRDRISQTEAVDGLAGETHDIEADGVDYYSAPALPLPQGG